MIYPKLEEWRPSGPGPHKQGAFVISSPSSPSTSDKSCSEFSDDSSSSSRGGSDVPKNSESVKRKAHDAFQDTRGETKEPSSEIPAEDTHCKRLKGFQAANQVTADTRQVEPPAAPKQQSRYWTHEENARFEEALQM